MRQHVVKLLLSIYTQESRVIQLTQKSSCLIVPPYFIDAVNFSGSAEAKLSPTRPDGKIVKKEEDESNSKSKSRAQSPRKKKSRSSSPSTLAQGRVVVT